MRRKRPRGRKWVLPINTYSKRMEYSYYFTLLTEARLSNEVTFFELFTRMTPTKFEELVVQITPYIRRRGNNFCKPITVGERLAMTLRFLATRESFKSISFGFRVGKSTCSETVAEVCQVLYDVLSPVYLAVPSTGDWLQIAREFDELWDFPHCIGALDGKHIRLKCPPNSGSDFYIYKGFFSIILLAMCDARYRFTIIDVGALGREGDRGVFNSSVLADSMADKSLGIPPPQAMPYSEKVLPYVIVGDEAFPLKTNLMRPYPGVRRGTMDLDNKIYNYRLSRSRRIIENSFGIMAARWRLFQTEINALPENVEIFTKAACVLHNMLVTTSSNYNPSHFTDYETGNGVVIHGAWRSQVSQLNSTNLRRNCERYKYDAWTVREQFKDFLNNEGAVPWQLDHVTYSGPHDEASSEYDESSDE